MVRSATPAVADGAVASSRASRCPAAPRPAAAWRAILLVVLFLVLTQCVGGTWAGTGGGTAFDLGAAPAGCRADSSPRASATTTAGPAPTPRATPTAPARRSRSPRSGSGRRRSLSRPARGYSPPRINTFTGRVATACGQASSQVGPFYCPADEQVYLDTTFFDDVLEGRLGGQGGDFVEPYVLAHEYGHHIQNLLGTMGKVRTQQGPESDAGTAGAAGGLLRRDVDPGRGRARPTTAAWPSSPSWTRATSPRRSTPPRPWATTGSSSAAAAGSTRRAGPTAPRSSGSSWFRVGHDRGDLAACDTFAADDL